MGETTGISWTDHTFNPWIGCSKVSAGCTNCYAERENNLYKWTDQWGDKGTRRRTSEANWKKPLAWDMAAARDGVRRKVFCASLADVFEDKPDLFDWREELFVLVEETENLDWLILTKRPENVIKWYGAEGVYPDEVRQNVWLGVTAENQEMADKRIPLLLDIPAKIRFVSVEPMIGNINFTKYDRIPDWIICGGESGPNARPMDLDWARNLRHQCEVTYAPFFFKQVGGTKRIDGHWGGDLLDGVRYQEFPK